jgi:hypothetical protein
MESSYKLAGVGGASVGIRVDGGQGTTMTANRATNITGGRGAGEEEMAAEERGLGGNATGYLLQDVAGGLTFSNNTAGHIAIGEGKTGAWGACVDVVDGGPVTIAHLTCMNAPSGVLLQDGSTPSVELVNSIITTTEDGCLTNLQGSSTKLLATYSDLWQCGNLEALNAEVDDSCMAKDPLLVAQPKGEPALDPASPCIDAGDPEANCNLEAEPNGCQVNLGAYGNTPEATPKDGAENCPICPGGE